MQTQEIIWWWEFLKVAIPTLTALGVPFITYRWLTRKMADYQTVLSKEIEDYKKDISKELEIYKIQLQSDFQTKFYEFQTRFSLLQQKRAEVFSEIISMSFSILKDIAQLEFEKEQIENLGDNFDLFENYFFKNRLYIDNELKQMVDELCAEIHKIIMEILSYLTSTKKRDENSDDIFRNQIMITAEKLSIPMQNLEDKFTEALFPKEAADKKIETEKNLEIPKAFRN